MIKIEVLFIFKDNFHLLPLDPIFLSTALGILGAQIYACTYFTTAIAIDA